MPLRALKRALFVIETVQYRSSLFIIIVRFPVHLGIGKSDAVSRLAIKQKNVIKRVSTLFQQALVTWYVTHAAQQSVGCGSLQLKTIFVVNFFMILMVPLVEFAGLR